VVGLKGCSEAPKVSSTTRGLPDGKIPTTGSPTTEDIGQAEQFAFSVVQGRPTNVAKCICAPTRAGELEVLSHEVRAKETRLLTFRDPPPPPWHSRTDFEKDAQGLLHRHGSMQNRRYGIVKHPF
jgi:hypothetical protein